MSGSNNPFYLASKQIPDNEKIAETSNAKISTEKVDLSDPELENAKKEKLLEVRDLNSSINWCSFGYVGTTNVLKVVDKGSGGWKEAVESLSSGKQMFVFLRISIDETSVPKFVYLTYNPPNVPPLQKGLMHGRSYDIGKFIGQIHLQIDAISESDLKEDKMLQKLKKSANK